MCVCFLHCRRWFKGCTALILGCVSLQRTSTFLHSLSPPQPHQVTHALSGGRLEVMGILQGKVEGDTMIVVDCFAIPVKGMSRQFNVLTCIAASPSTSACSSSPCGSFICATERTAPPFSFFLFFWSYVQGTETQVNASDAESAFMAQHSMLVRQVTAVQPQSRRRLCAHTHAHAHTCTRIHTPSLAKTNKKNTHARTHTHAHTNAHNRPLPLPL